MTDVVLRPDPSRMQIFPASEHAAYLGEPPEQSFVVVHPADAPSGVALLLAPPFGWEEVTSYRARRAWAQHLAGQGHTCLRLTFPGTGDSGSGPREPARLAAWTASVDQAARHLRTAWDARAIVVLGIGLGGLLACQAATERGGIDAFVLWSVPSRGFDFVRQMRTFSRMERAVFWGDRDPPAPPHDGDLEAGGFVLSHETVEALRTLDVERMDLHTACPGGALLLGRDGIAVDERLARAFAADRVTLAPSDGYGAMTAHPQTTELPDNVVETVDTWLHDHASDILSCATPVGSPPPCADELLLESGTREHPITLAASDACLRGVLLSPGHRRTPPLAVIFLNAGAQRRTGPNRMWVEAARRWAALGVPSVRLDVKGIGDADGELTPYRANATLHTDERISEVVAAVGELQARGIADRFMLVGLCASAYWAFHALLREPAVCAAVSINLTGIVWADELAPSRDLRRVFTDRSWALIRKNATRERVAALVRWLASMPVRWAKASLDRLSGASADRRTTSDVLDELLACGKRLTLAFAEREPLVQELARGGRLADLERSDTVQVVRLEVNDHTLRPTWAQQQAHRVLDAALEREFADLAADEPETRVLGPR